MMASPTGTTSAAPPAVGRTSCPACTRPLGVPPALAGKAIKCGCGHVFTAPTMAQMADAAHRAAAEQALKRGYTPAHKRVATDDENPAPEPSALLDFLLPVALLPLGVILSFVQAMHYDKRPMTFQEIVGPTTLGIVLATGLMIVAVLIAGLSLGIVFHTKPWQTALKIASVALIPCALGGIVDHSVGGFNGNLVSVLVSVGLYVALVKLILRLPWDHTGIIVLACWCIRTFTMYAIYRFGGAMHRSWI